MPCFWTHAKNQLDQCCAEITRISAQHWSNWLGLHYKYLQKCILLGESHIFTNVFLKIIFFCVGTFKNSSKNIYNSANGNHYNTNSMSRPAFIYIMNVVNKLPFASHFYTFYQIFSYCYTVAQVSLRLSWGNTLLLTV